MKSKVLIMRCDDYDAEKIAGIIREGMQELGVRPAGKILLKPNVVIAHPELFPHAFTRKEFLDGVISATRSRAVDVKEIAVGERSGITIPTRFNFRQAGYFDIIKKHGIKTYFFDEVKQVPVPLDSRQNLRKKLFVPKPVVDCDFLINVPKFKAHPWCRLTLSLKNFVGIQDDRHRLVDHNLFLEHKIADLQEVVQSGFVVIDAITAGQKMMLTPTPFHLGAIVMGTNSCAVDTVGCHMVHVNPEDVLHLKYASQRGFGPMRLEEIDVSGDFSLEAVRKRTTHFEFCMQRIDDYFDQQSNITCTVGTFPEKHSPDYCWGGCPGALQEAMHIFRKFYPDVDKTMGKVRYVIGKVDGPLELEKDEKVLFVGDCTRWKGIIDGQALEIENRYKSASEIDESKTKSNDMLLKTGRALWSCFRNRRSRYLHARGCTLSVAEHIHYLSALAGIKNVNFDSRLLLPINMDYWKMRLGRFYNRLRDFLFAD